MDIMVVDDDSTFVFIFHKQIQKFEDVEVINESSNGAEALSFFRTALEESKDLPDIIVLDLNMPIMNGWAFLDEFTDICVREGIEIPVCILSSTINQADFDRANTYQMVKSFFSKPITSDQIEAMRRISEIY